MRTKSIMRNHATLLALGALLLLLCAPAAEAGTESIIARGFKPNIAYQVNEFDAVNTFNGNLLVNIPLGPTYKTNGTLSYSFGLRYTAEFWNYINYYGINQPGNDPTHITIIDGDGGWNTYSTTVIELGPGGPTGGGDNFIGAEAVPTGMVGPGWMVATESFSQVVKNEYYRGGVYTDSTGASHVFTPNMHARTDCGGSPCTNTVAYTHDGSYLRMRLVNGDPLVREVDLPDGTIKHFRCVSNCDNWGAQWQLEWTADQYGNVLLQERVDANGNPVVGRPQPGQWIWNYTEGVLPDGETRSDPYYRGTPGDRAALKITRQHRLTFSVEDPNGKYAQYPWYLGIRLVRAELAGPHGDRSMVFTFDYQPRQLLRPTVLPYILEPSRLLFPYTVDKRINVMMLASITQPDNAGKWQFDYYNGGTGEGEGMTYTFCGDYTAPSGQCPINQQYPTSRIAGRVKSVRMPAGGGYSYEYGSRTFPKRPCFPQARSALAYGGGSAIAVKKRQQLNADGQPVSGAVWLYAGNGYFRTFIDADHDGWDDSDTDHSGDWNIGDTMICRAPVEFLASSLDPNGLLTLNYYNLKFGDEWYGAPYSPEPDRADTLTRRDLTTAQRFLSSQVYQVDMGAESPFKENLASAVRRLFPAYRRNDPETVATLLRSTYATFDRSAVDCDPTTEDCEFYNLRMTSQHTRFHDDNTSTTFPGPNDTIVTEKAYVETLYGDFDGVGHFRQKNTYGNLRVVGRQNATAADWDHRMEYTLFNPDVSWNPGQLNPTGLPQNWILHNYTHMSTMEPGWLVSTRYHFDSKRGFLRVKRKMETNGTSAGIPIPPDSGRELVAATGPDDLLSVYSRIQETDDDGHPIFVSREENYGGDSGALGGWAIIGDTASIPVAARRDYTIDTTYRAGSLAKTEYRSCDTSRAYLQASSSSIEKGMGLPVSTTDESGLTTSYAYDSLGRIINMTPPGDLVPETYAYDVKTGLGGMNRLVLSRSGGATTTFIYDGLGRLISEADEMPSGTSTKAYTYTATGKLFQEFLPFGNRGYIEHQYDVFDRETKTTGADNKVVDIGYASARSATRTTRNVAGESGSMSVLGFQAFDSFGRVWLVTDDATRAEYEYDAASNLIHAIINPSGQNGTRQHRRFHYDGRGVLVTVTQPELREAGTDNYVISKNSYDARGHVVATDLQWQGAGTKNLDMWRLRFDYDPAERLIEVWQPIPNGRKTLKSFEFYSSTDSPGRRGRLKASVRHNYFPDPTRTGGLPTINVTTTRSYNACTGNITQCSGQLTSVNTTASAPSANGSPAQAFFSGTVGYQYNTLGEIKRIDYPTFGPASPSRSISYHYTKQRLTSITEGQARRATVSYHLNGLPNVIQLAADGVSDTIVPDGSGLKRPGRIDWTWKSGAGTTGAYTYDGAGNVSAMGGDTFKYDGAFRLKRAQVAGQVQAYEYDGFSNPTSVGGQGFNVDWKSNRLTAPYEYDDGGNLKVMPDPSGGVLTFAYDALNMMISADGERLGRAFVYDAADERIGVIDYKAAGGRRERWSIRSQGNQVLRDFERTFTDSTPVWKWTRDYVYRGSLLSNTIGPDTGVRDIHLDHQGSVRFVTDSAGNLVTGTGATTSGTRYWPFGALVFKRLLDERMAFTGHERDDDGTAADSLDLDYMHARYYRPAAARFLSVDPTWESADMARPQSWNRYTYVMNNPLNMTDPDGKCPICILVVFGVAGSVLLSPAPANAPGPGDPTYADTDPAGIGGAATGVAIGMGVRGAKKLIVEKGLENAAGDDPKTNDRARQVADEQQAAGRTQGTAGSLETKDGKVHNSTSGQKAHHPEVQRALDNVPQDQRSPYHGKCAEPGCISKSLESGSDPRGGNMETAKIRKPGNPQHGEPHEPCGTCKWLLDFFGIDW